MDDTMRPIIQHLCVMAGTIMEDVSQLAISALPVASEEVGDHVDRLASAVEDIRALICAARELTKWPG